MSKRIPFRARATKTFVTPSSSTAAILDFASF
jgi:hypothetical protein